MPRARPDALGGRKGDTWRKRARDDRAAIRARAELGVAAEREGPGPGSRAGSGAEGRTEDGAKAKARTRAAANGARAERAGTVMAL